MKKSSIFFVLLRNVRKVVTKYILHIKNRHHILCLISLLVVRSYLLTNLACELCNIPTITPNKPIALPKISTTKTLTNNEAS